MPSKGREMIEHVRAAFGVSIRKRCRAIPACRATYHYRTANCVRARAELAGTREISRKARMSGAIGSMVFHALPSPQAADDGAQHSLADPNV